MNQYASKSKVDNTASRNEIERTLTRYGAESFMYGWEETRAVIGFKMKDRNVRFVLPMPVLEDFTRTPTGRRRTSKQTKFEFEQAKRQRWRALSLVIKAKLEAVESEITCFEDEFMAHIVLPNGQTVGHWMQPQIESAYENGVMPKLLALTGENG